MPDMNMTEIISDAFIDTVRLLPFLFLTYAAMEYMEQKMGEKAKRAIEKSGQLGAFWGAVLGAFPQCGFSAAASNLFAGRVITLGTLLAIYLSTSDEMLPILISEQVKVPVILGILGIKAAIGMAVGFMADLFIHRREEAAERGGLPHGEGPGHMDAGRICRHGHCRCEEGIFRSAVRHTIQIALFIFLCSFTLTFIMDKAGEDFLAGLVLGRPVLGHLIAGLIGLIPNCAASVTITRLYLEGVIGFGVMMAGLLAGSGVGVLVLFRVNDNRKENLKIALLLYAAGVAAGVLLDMAGIVMG